jgi:hypothetical protein
MKLAKSAAPISDHASGFMLAKDGYRKAQEGTNGREPLADWNSRY